MNRLTKHTDGEIAGKARSLIKKWKEYFEAKLDRPLLEVRSDHKTEELRSVARKHLAASLQCQVSVISHWVFVFLQNLTRVEIFQAKSNLCWDSGFYQ